MTPIHQQRINWFSGTRPSNSPIQKICRAKETHANIKLGDRSRSRLETDLPTKRNPRQNQIWWQEQKSIGVWFAHPKPTPKSTLVRGAVVNWRLICPPKSDTESTLVTEAELDWRLICPPKTNLERINLCRGTRSSNSPAPNQHFGDQKQKSIGDWFAHTKLMQNQLWWQEQKLIGDWFIYPKPTPKPTLVTAAEVDSKLIYQPKTGAYPLDSTGDQVLWR
jgi:hypothetical protein